MPNAIHFYFDLISPFAYLAHQVLPALARRHGVPIEYHVTEIGELKRLAGNNGPSNRNIPLKRRYLQSDKERWAKRYGVPIVNPTSYDATRLNCGVFYALDRGQTQEYVARAWHLVWGIGGDTASVALFQRVANELGWNVEEALRFTESEEVAERYRNSSHQAHEHGVFGVPSVVLDDQMWWGNDRLEFLDEYLKQYVTA